MAKSLVKLLSYAALTLALTLLIKSCNERNKNYKTDYEKRLGNPDFIVTYVVNKGDGLNDITYKFLKKEWGMYKDDYKSKIKELSGKDKYDSKLFIGETLKISIYSKAK